MAVLIALPTNSGSNTFTDFQKYLKKSHQISLVSLYNNVLEKLEKYGFDINQSFKRDTIKKLDSELYELRIKNIRTFLYFESGIIVLLHSFIKKSQKTPRNEIIKAKEEIKQWKKKYQNVC